MNNWALLKKKKKTGAWSEYAKAPENFFSLKPTNLSFDDAASIPLAALTAFQALQSAGDLNGKTVFIPAGCE
jgi:NADPH:quinone reductase-like Zn-dependent oxidoreductase